MVFFPHNLYQIVYLYFFVFQLVPTNCFSLFKESALTLAIYLDGNHNKPNAGLGDRDRNKEHAHRRAAEGEGRLPQGAAVAEARPREAELQLQEVPRRQQEAPDREVDAGEEAGAPEVHGESAATRPVRHAAPGRHLRRELGGRLRLQRHHEAAGGDEPRQGGAGQGAQAPGQEAAPARQGARRQADEGGQQTGQVERAESALANLSRARRQQPECGANRCRWWQRHELGHRQQPGSQRHIIAL